MALSSRPRPFRDSALFVIGLEGEMSGAEYRYFQEVLKLELLDHRRVRFEFLPTSADDHRSDPEAVFARVKRCIDERGLQAFDRAWLVLDFDSWGERKLSAVALRSKQCSFTLAVSNPCFELWLLLHRERFDSESIAAGPPKGRSQAAKAAWGAEKTEITSDSVLRARLEARRLAAGGAAGARWPSCPGSDVYLLFDGLATMSALAVAVGAGPIADAGGPSARGGRARRG